MIDQAALDRAVRTLLWRLCWPRLKIIELNTVRRMMPKVIAEYHRQRSA